MCCAARRWVASDARHGGSHVPPARLFSIIPEQTLQVARAAFPKGNPYMLMHDTLDPIYTNPEFAALFPKTGQPAEAPAHLALITIMQFAEGLSDAQAADAVRARIDWKYALALELTTRLRCLGPVRVSQTADCR
jgi:transposase